MRVSDFAFDLPPDLIAQTPRPRGLSRLLVVNRQAGAWEESTIAGLPRFLDAGDLLVVNDTRVFPARLLGRRDPSGGAVECFLLEPATGADATVDGAGVVWHALVHPGQKLKPGARMVFENVERAPEVAIRGEILARRFSGRRLVRLEPVGALTLDAAIDAIGHVPLPPYIARPDVASDRERYQTVFARARGSVAAPTAGLHFDDRVLAGLAAAGIGRAAVTLHVGYGTFKPVRADRVEDHVVDPERFEIAPATAEAIAETHRAGRRVVAVGTTTTRALESAACGDHRVAVGPGEARIFLHPTEGERPGAAFRVVDGLVTNFHLPESSLLMLVSAFAGRDLILAAYREAIARGFHFYSYGDAMLVI
jgi:S-adenosylmethionine:tRNA ribosyltransferase-isomerase